MSDVITIIEDSDVLVIKEEEKTVQVVTIPEGLPGYTPIKGIDYFDGDKGDPGDNVILVASSTILGGIKVGENLKIDENGVLSVDTATDVEQDNTKPVTSAAVHVQLGNVEVLLASL